MASPTEEDMENIYRLNFQAVQASTTEEELYRNLRATATPQTKNALAAWFDAQDTVIDFMEKYKIIPNKIKNFVNTITDIGELNRLKVEYSDFKRYAEFERDVNSRIRELRLRPKPKIIKRPKVKKKPKKVRPRRLARYRWSKGEINYIKKHPTFSIKKLKKSKVLRRRSLNAIYLKRWRLFKKRRHR